MGSVNAQLLWCSLRKVQHNKREPVKGDKPVG